MAKKSASKDGECGQTGGEDRRLLRVDDRLEGFDDSRFEQCCAAIKLAVTHRVYDRAHQELDLFIRDSGKTDAVTLDSPIWVLESYVELCVLENLDNMGFMNLRSIDMATDRDLVEGTVIGERRLFQLRTALDELLPPR